MENKNNNNNNLVQKNQSIWDKHGNVLFIPTPRLYRFSEEIPNSIHFFYLLLKKGRASAFPFAFERKREKV